MSRIFGLFSTFSITGMILFGLAADFRISFDRYYWASAAAILTIVLILATRRIYLPIKPLESLIPDKKQDAVVVLLVLLQMLSCFWDFCYYIRLALMLPSIGTCVIVIFILASYLKGKKWAWGLIFLFSIYSLHEAICLGNDWDYDFYSYAPKWIVLLVLIASALCLRIMASTANAHHINRQEFARIFGAIVIVVGIIFVKVDLLYSWKIWPWDIIRGYVNWDFLVGESALQPWLRLALLWTCYAGVCFVSWIYTQKVSLKKDVVQV